ncbi:MULTISPECIES: ABC transporter ATP-binding protein [unclassified Chelatococcus]|uniref:ABC transporter ATP-binding protein n=1 Tax=unclassified Chelatococcus TaxID=2638111 RepID=UPI0020C02E7C|nr:MULTISPECIES: ABC transporter ATP-binding protein [unclassified Chelatococcus]MCO5077232.1 ABC transporter ATP-binding protein [Chelatococcus sp.]CAH1662584.1 Spermidine/putrescine import ATP-binding protein PotA [Hyphomicrobiales bacterium]CAH1682631.1 Spermidine/putrescine import ATP-binding protein PotA [Hyphomicrobiales bacterium]
MSFAHAVRDVFDRPIRRAARPGQAALAGAITVDNLTKTYGRATALHDVSLEISSGQFMTLLGPSGSGKTTLLMSIAGFVSPSAGTIKLNGEVINHLPPDRREFGMVFQGYALFPHLTVAQNIAFPLRVRHRPKPEIEEQVKRALDMVQLDRFADRFPRQLSGGQQQRAALARALVFEPSIVLLDEPLSALDKNLRHDLQGELKDLHNRVGLTFIYVTHDQQEALSMSDEIAILSEGRLVQLGSPATLYEKPATRFVAGFLGQSNFISGQVETVSGDAFTYRSGATLLRQAGGAHQLVGSSVTVTIRPEKIRLLGPQDTADNIVTGRIAKFSYYGGHYHLQVDVEGIGRIMLDAPTWGREPPSLDDAIRIGWDAAASVTVAA